MPSGQDSQSPVIRVRNLVQGYCLKDPLAETLSGYFSVGEIVAIAGPPLVLAKQPSLGL